MYEGKEGTPQCKSDWSFIFYCVYPTWLLTDPANSGIIQWLPSSFSYFVSLAPFLLLTPASNKAALATRVSSKFLKSYRFNPDPIQRTQPFKRIFSFSLSIGYPSSNQTEIDTAVTNTVTIQYSFIRHQAKIYIATFQMKHKHLHS